MNENLKHRFAHHPPTKDTVPLHEGARGDFLYLAESIAQMGESREMSLALTHLETALFWVNAHIARNISAKA